jgi:hypothetical protein
VTLWHRHRWVATAEPRFVPGLLENGGKASGYLRDEVLFGYTELSQRCSACGEARVSLLVGRWQESP